MSCFSNELAFFSMTTVNTSDSSFFKLSKLGLLAMLAKNKSLSSIFNSLNELFLDTREYTSTCSLSIDLDNVH